MMGKREEVGLHPAFVLVFILVGINTADQIHPPHLLSV
jgi:hypothetical protein